MAIVNSLRFADPGPGFSQMPCRIRRDAYRHTIGLTGYQQRNRLSYSCASLGLVNGLLHSKALRIRYPPPYRVNLAGDARTAV